MAIIVEYSSATWRDFFLPTFLLFPTLEAQLRTEFATYKETGLPSDLLGRDAPFDFPPFAVEANVHHIHINPGNDKSWHRRQENYHRTSNHYLIYTEHLWDSDRFLLMGLVTPAHQKMPASDNRLLSHFAEVAEDFHAS